MSSVTRIAVTSSGRFETLGQFLELGSYRPKADLSVNRQQAPIFISNLLEQHEQPQND